MSVPPLSGPAAPQSPGTRQKTIAELLTQWEELTRDAMAATGDTENWYRSPIIEKILWDPKDEWVSLAPCSTRGSKDSHHINASVQHEPFGLDPHLIMDKLIAHLKEKGFTLTRGMDWTPPDGETTVDALLDRADGVRYGLFASTDLVSIHVYTECSTHPSIDDWAEARLQKRFESLFPTPRATPSASPGEGKAGTGHNTMAAAIDPANPFRQFLREESAPAPEDALDHSDLFSQFREDMSPSAETRAEDDGWVW
ncbi:hypothetical protein [Leifsonia sp. NPDC077715]|uniref:hypothetical protein n=1 Tax=Leifsonia sp. NPDC077715 TaxID=3155539 RepID=UPI00343BF17F